MNSKNSKATPSKESSNDLTSQIKVTSIYDDDNIPEIDTSNLIPDEVPRSDGPGGE